MPVTHKYTYYTVWIHEANSTERRKLYTTLDKEDAVELAKEVQEAHKRRIPAHVWIEECYRIAGSTKRDKK